VSLQAIECLPQRVVGHPSWPVQCQRVVYILKLVSELRARAQSTLQALAAESHILAELSGSLSERAILYHAEQALGSIMGCARLRQPTVAPSSSQDGGPAPALELDDKAAAQLNAETSLLCSLAGLEGDPSQLGSRIAESTSTVAPSLLTTPRSSAHLDARLSVASMHQPSQSAAFLDAAGAQSHSPPPLESRIRRSSMILPLNAGPSLARSATLATDDMFASSSRHSALQRGHSPSVAGSPRDRSKSAGLSPRGATAASTTADGHAISHAMLASAHSEHAPSSRAASSTAACSARRLDAAMSTAASEASLDAYALPGNAGLQDEQRPRLGVPAGRSDSEAPREAEEQWETCTASLNGRPSYRPPASAQAEAAEHARKAWLAQEMDSVASGLQRAQADLQEIHAHLALGVPAARSVHEVLNALASGHVPLEWTRSRSEAQTSVATPWRCEPAGTAHTGQECLVLAGASALTRWLRGSAARLQHLRSQLAQPEGEKPPPVHLHLLRHADALTALAQRRFSRAEHRPLASVCMKLVPTEQGHPAAVPIVGAVPCGALCPPTTMPVAPRRRNYSTWPQTVLQLVLLPRICHLQVKVHPWQALKVFGAARKFGTQCHMHTAQHSVLTHAASHLAQRRDNFLGFVLVHRGMSCKQHSSRT
jgi:Dynein heavy chain C-terminal domain